MKRNRSSITAQGIAAIRAIESGRPAAQRICYDPLARLLVRPGFLLLAKLFAPYGEWRAPGTTGFLVARTRYIDDYLQACLDSGIEQLVILGAGLDSRAYRFPLRAHVRVFEVDHPATQRGKCDGLKRIFGMLPEHVTYYLTAEAVDSTLQFMASSSGEGSSVIFDYVYVSALTASRKRGEIARMQRYGRVTGEQLTFGITEGKVAEFLCQRGYRQIKNVTAADLRSAYCTGHNRNRTVAPIYAIVHATV